MKRQILIRLRGETLVDAEVGGQVVKTDLSPKSGGGGTAPDPFALFLASIGTCTGHYLAGFCAKHGIPTEGVSLVETVYLGDADGELERIVLEIRTPKDFPEKTRKTLASVAENCKVKKTIAASPPIEITSVPVD
jgi:putative redox protein